MKFSLLLSGKPGTGKTRILYTARRPVLIDLFDPNKTLVLDILTGGKVCYFTGNEIPEAELEYDFFCRRFHNEHHARPTEYERWRKQFDRDLVSGFFNLFGTYSLDSHTNWLAFATNYLIKKLALRDKKGKLLNQLTLRDYPHIYNEARDVIFQMSGPVCDFIMTTHADLVQDLDEKGNSLGPKYMKLMTYNQLQTILPSNFTEHYIACKEETSKGTDYYLLTGMKNKYVGMTALGAEGKLDLQEKPDLKAILRKVGLEPSDRPSLTETYSTWKEKQK